MYEYSTDFGLNSVSVLQNTVFVSYKEAFWQMYMFLVRFNSINIKLNGVARLEPRSLFEWQSRLRQNASLPAKKKA